MKVNFAEPTETVNGFTILNIYFTFSKWFGDFLFDVLFLNIDCIGYKNENPLSLFKGKCLYEPQTLL